MRPRGMICHHIRDRYASGEKNQFRSSKLHSALWQFIELDQGAVESASTNPRAALIGEIRSSTISSVANSSVQGVAASRNRRAALRSRSKVKPDYINAKRPQPR